MKLAFSKRERRALAVFVAVAILVGWAYLAHGIAPLRRRGVALGQQVSAARRQLALLEGAVANEEGLREEFRLADERVSALRHLLPSPEELPIIIERLSDFAAQTQVRIQTILPQRADESEDDAWPPGEDSEAGGAASDPVVYEEVLIQIDAVAGYHQVGSFIALVEAETRPMRVISLRVTGNEREPRRHHVKMLVRMYVAKPTWELSGA
jgi:Tfp pilus assembly protein PilO